MTARFFALLFFGIAFVAVPAACFAQAAPDASPSPSASPSPLPSASPVVAVTGATPEPQTALYDMADDIYSINRETTLYYYFQGNRDGSAKVKQELRYGRNVSADGKDQIKIRIPVITKFPIVGNPYSGLGNIELGYSRGVTSEWFDQTYEIRGAFNTNANNVDNHDTEIKGFYTTKWRWRGGSLSYSNEYDQSVIVPPNATWTSYYEGKLQLPDMAFASPLQKVKLSLFWNFRVLFDSGGIFKDALGATIYGSWNDFAYILTDSWGIGANGLWKYKFEANASARF